MSPLAVFGPGLIGGSVALAWRRAFSSQPLRIWARREEAAVAAARLVGGDCTAFHGDEGVPAAVQGAAMIVLCTPIETYTSLVEKMLPVLDAQAVVTEVGSAKAEPFAETARILGPQFVGAHPMAGSERSGLDAARADLFEGALCILTPSELSSQPAIDATATFWRTIGCRIVQCTPAAHDDAVARVSHAPHVAAAALVLLARNGLQEFAGPGYRDCTRVALGSPSLWREILLANDAATISALADFEKQIAAFRNALISRDAKTLEALLRKAAEIRSTLPAPPPRPEIS